MNRRTITLALAVTLVAALAIVPLAVAGPGKHRGHAFGPGGGDILGILGHLAHVKEELDLTDEQAAALREIFKETREQNAAYRDEVRGGFHDVAQLLLDDPENVAGAQTLIDQRAAVHRAMKTNMLNGVSKALKVLTPEQREKLSEILAERAARFEERRGR